MKRYLSPRWSMEIVDCAMPMSFDTYSNCSYGCAYCFSAFQRETFRNAVDRTKNAYLQKEFRAVSAEKVIENFKRSLDGENPWQFAEYIRQKKVMQWGGLSDQFDEYERRHGVTLRLLKFFKEIDYPLCFSTKATWWTQDERYVELFKGQSNWNVKVSIITLDAEKARRIERGCPSPLERIDALARIASWNCGGATLRLRPFIIGISTPSYRELIERSADAGVDAMSTEFFCYEQRSHSLEKKRALFAELCGFDLFDFYKRYSPSTGYLRLNRNVKRPFFEIMRAICERRGIRFYVSDAHFKELCENGCCCGLTEEWNYSRGQWCEALMVAKRNGVVRWSDISKEIDLLHSRYPWARADGYNNGSSERRAKFWGMSMRDYLLYLWNNPQRAQSPYLSFEGVLVPDGKDDDGNIVYRYNPALSLPMAGAEKK